MKKMYLLPMLLLAAGLTAGRVNADGGSISAAEAASHVGESARVCSRVAGANYGSETRGQPTFLNLDRAYPNHVFTALIWGNKRAAFPYAPESLRGQRICVTGTIQLYEGKAEIIVVSPTQLKVEQ